ncbi:MAG: hypothetical protein K0Q71_2184 [Thermomicrobiales bacterium]|nr:hypothetical protein [Thermomicrobiales bacterium]
MEPSTAGSLRSAAACTIIAANYLSHARVLASSYLEHHPDAHFYLLVVDDLPSSEAIDDRIRLVHPDELELASFSEMTVKYDVTELSTAVKPTLLRTILDRFSEENVVYLDPDIQVMRPLAELREALTEANIVLTPHILAPLPSDGMETSERSILVAGTYNLGFIAVRNSPDTHRFLDWWEQHLYDDCVVDPSRGLMVDQRWIDLAPHLFKSQVASLDDETYNVAYWNLSTRPIEKVADGHFVINEKPLAFFHFSGFDPREPRRLSKHQNRITVEEGSPLAELLDGYARLQFQHGFAVSSKWPYGFADFENRAFDNGIAFNALLRSLYIQSSPEERLRFGDLSRTTGPNSFYEWATAPRPEEGRHSRFLEELYRQRTDVRAVFPDITGVDEEAFLQWAATRGSEELDFDPRLVRQPTLEERINQIVRLVLPFKAKVLVPQEADEGMHIEWLEVHPVNPAPIAGTPGKSPVYDPDRVVEQFAQMADQGAQYLLIPRTSFQRFGAIRGLRERLEERNWLVWSDRHCVIHQLWRSGEYYRLPSLAVMGRQLWSLDNLRRQVDPQMVISSSLTSVSEARDMELERRIEALEQRLAAQTATTLQTLSLLERVQRRLARDS